MSNLIKTYVTHRNAYIFGLMLVAAGLPLSPFLMSAGQGVLLINWIAEGRIREKLDGLRKKPSVWFVAGIFLLHLAGLFYTSDWAYALKDVKIKLPILILLTVIASTPSLNRKELNSLLSVFIAAVFTSSMVSIYILLTRPIPDLRYISPIISHIRLSLMASITVFCCIVLSQQAGKVYLKILLYLAAIWFFLFIGILGARAGYLALFCIFLFIGLRQVFVRRKWITASFILAALLILPFLAYNGISSVKKRVDEVVQEVRLYREGNTKASGYSIMQRFVYWEISADLIRENPVLGVGTGDVDHTFRDYYRTHDTGLSREYQQRAHNQYITMAIAFGLTGLLIFTVCLFGPAILERKYADTMYMVFFITALLSMLTEDTLETQAGATFFAFFNTLFLYAQPNKK